MCAAECGTNTPAPPALSETGSECQLLDDAPVVKTSDETTEVDDELPKDMSRMRERAIQARGT